MLNVIQMCDLNCKTLKILNQKKTELNSKN